MSRRTAATTSPPSRNIADTRSDLNYDGRVTPAASNRLIVQADADGEVCLRASSPVDMIVDINGTTDAGIGSFANRRTDTRSRVTLAPQVAANGVVRIAVPEAVGAKTVIGQLTVDRAAGWGYVTAAGCDELASNPGLVNSRSDLNYDGQITRAASNRLIVQADADGEICLRTTSAADVIVDINAVAGAGIVSFPNQRTDTRSGATTLELPGIGEVPVWPPFTPLPALDGLAALTGESVSADITRRPDRRGQDRQLPTRSTAVGARPRRRGDRAERRRRHPIRRAVPDRSPGGRAGAVGADVRPRSALRDESARVQLLGGEHRRRRVDPVGRELGRAGRLLGAAQRLLRPRARSPRPPQPELRHRLRGSPGHERRTRLAPCGMSSPPGSRPSA